MTAYIAFVLFFLTCLAGDVIYYSMTNGDIDALFEAGEMNTILVGALRMSILGGIGVAAAIILGVTIVALYGDGSFLPSLEVGLWCFLPALAANQGAGIARRFGFPGAALPISERWLGANKTWAAYYMGPLCALVALGVQIVLARNYPSLATLWPRVPDGLFLVDGAAIGLGATLFGDHLESFVKRRLRIPPGDPFFPFDQTDFAFGGTLGLLFVCGWPGLGPFAAFCIFMLVLHPAGNWVGVKLKLRERM